MRRKYLIKLVIKYTFLLAVLIVATLFTYDLGKKEYKKYLNNHKDDEKWVDKNINLIENYQIGDGVLSVDMPKDLKLDNKSYNKAVSDEINKLLINSYKIEEPLFIYDPFKFDETSLNIYFYTGEKYKFEYYITTDSISNGTESFEFIRMKNEDGTDILNNKHFYILKGLKTGKKNNLIIRILDEYDNIIDSQNFIIKAPK